MKIRPALPSDALRLSALEEQLFTADNYPLSRHSFYYHIRNNLLLVAETDRGEIAGYTLALIRRRDAKLYSLGIAQPYRGKGVASMLMKAVLEALGKRGFKRTLLEVRCDNIEAVALYKRFGFVVTNELGAFYRDGCNAYLMEQKDA